MFTANNNSPNQPANDQYEAGDLYPYPLGGSTSIISRIRTDGDDNVPVYSRKIITARAKKLYANMGAIKNAIQEKAEFTVGDAFRVATYLGRNQSWGKKATVEVNKWIKRNNIQQALRQVCIALERDGDCLVVFTKYNKGLKLFRSNQIGSREDGILKRGKYKGLEIQDGVIIDKLDQVVAYNILGNKDDGSADTQVDRLDCVLVFDPEYIGQRRGISGLAQAITKFEEYSKIVNFEIRGIKHASSFAVQAHVEPKDMSKFTSVANVPKGFGNSSIQLSGSNPAEKALDIQVEEIQGGNMQVFRAGSGAKLEVLDSNRPSANTATFIMDHILKQAFLSIRWPVELTYDLSSRGATTKLVISKASRTIDSRQSLVIRPLWERIVAQAVSWMIQDGILDSNNDAFLWQPDYPAQITIDTFRDTKSDIESFNKGFMTGQQVCSQYGYDYLANLREKAEELKYAKQLADEAGVPLETLIQMTPNGNMVPPEDDKSEDKKETEEDIDDKKENNDSEQEQEKE